MYEVTIEANFSAAHNLREYQGKCEALHGHNWKVEVSASSETLNHLGMVIDFVDLKKATREVVDSLDHRYLNETPPFDALNPSSENIARHIFDEVDRRLPSPGPRVSAVRVWESPTSSARYSRSR